MNLDLRTMMVVIAAMTFLFAGLLELAGLHAGNVRGVRLWALASLCISIGLSFAIALLTPGDSWVIVSGATFVAAGAGLQFVGIQAFKNQRCDWRVPIAVTLTMFASTTWFAVFHPDIEARAIANSLILGLTNAACARALFVRIKQPLRTAYWFTGAVFAVLALVFLIRAVVIVLSPAHSYGLFANLPINPATFFAASMTQLCITFGFVLMLNYRLASDLHDLASHDQLTGALNRRGLEEEATHMQARCLRTKTPLAVMLIDVDHFKQINDQYGHPAGDEVLRRLTAVIQMSIREEDYFARYGGEEFCVMLPAVAEQEVMVIAERLRQNYAATHVRFGEKTLTGTISIGVADSIHTGMVFDFLIAAADRAMYRAKETGRNRVVAYSSIEKIA